MALQLVNNEPDPRDEYPYWDEAAGQLLESNEAFIVEYDFHHNEPGDRVVLRKTVLKKGKTARAKTVIVWVGSVGVFQRAAVPGMMHEVLDLVIFP